MNLDQLVMNARDAITVKRVYAEPYEKDGTTIIAAASVRGGGGGGAGKDERGQEGEGGGFAAIAHPVGAYVINNGEVVWRPAVDVNRLLAGVMALLMAVLITLVRIQKVRAKSAQR